jgi:hypothetical protein
MAQYPKPSNNYPTFSQGTFTNPTTGGLTIDEGKKYFLTFPTQQANSTETMSTVLVQGTLGVAQTATFNNTVSTAIHSIGDVLLDDALNVGGITTLEGDLDITDSNIILNGTFLTNYIEFPDGTKQYSADAGISPYTVLNNQDNTYVAGFNQTFVGDINSVGINGPIVFTNTTSTGGTGSLYVDPNSGNDITIYSAQSTNSGLTVRNSTNSFTINPTTVNGINNIANFINPVNSTSNISTQNQLIIYDGSTFTNNTSIDQQDINLVLSNNSTGGAIVFNQVGGTNPQILALLNYGAILQNALYIRSPSNQYLSSSISQGANLTIFNECVSGLNSNIVFQLNNPISGQPVVQPLVIYSASVNCNLPLYAYQGITLSGGAGTGLITQNSSNATVIKNNYTNGDIQLVVTGTGGVSQNILNLNSTTQTLFNSPTTNNTPTQIATTGYVNTVVQATINSLDWSFSSPGFVTSNGAPDSTVNVTSLLPIENTTLVINGKNQIFQGSDLTWTQISPVFIEYFVVCSAKPCTPYPANIIPGTVTNNTTKTSYPVNLSFNNTGGVPGYTYLLTILPTTGVFASTANGQSWSLNLSSLPGF